MFFLYVFDDNNNIKIELIIVWFRTSFNQILYEKHINKHDRSLRRKKIEDLF